MEVLYFHYFNSILLQHFSIPGKILFLFLSLSFATLNSHVMDFPMVWVILLKHFCQVLTAMRFNKGRLVITKLLEWIMFAFFQYINHDLGL